MTTDRRPRRLGLDVRLANEQIQRAFRGAAAARGALARERFWFNDLCDCPSEHGRFGMHTDTCPTSIARNQEEA